MNSLLIVVIVVALVLVLLGALIDVVQFLLWVGLLLAVFAVIAWLLRRISGRRT